MVLQQLCSIALSLTIVSVFLIPVPAARAATKDERCFTMSPITNFDDKNCGPVKVRIQFKDCTTGTGTGAPFEATARFECKSKPKKLKYWYETSMLTADLKKKDDTYEVIKTYAMKFDTGSDKAARAAGKAPTDVEVKKTAAPAKDGKSIGVATGLPETYAPGSGVSNPGLSAGNSTNQPGKPKSDKKIETEKSKLDKKAESEKNKAEKKAESEKAKADEKAEAENAKTEKKSETGATKAERMAELTKAENEKKTVAAATPAPTPAPTAAPQATQTNQNAGKPTLTTHPEYPIFAINKIKLSGTVDGYYAYNFNQPPPVPVAAPYGASPAGNNTYTLPNQYHDQLTLNLAKVNLIQLPDPVGFRVDLGWGPLADNIAGNSDQSTRNIMQAYLSYRTPFGLVLDFGKFFSHFGFENVEPVLNWNYSYTYAFKNVTPTWHTGGRATMQLTDTLSASVALLNGSNNYYQTHRARTFGAQVKWEALPELKLIGNYMGGDEGIATGDYRNTYELIAVYSPLSALKVAGDYSLVTQKVEGTEARQASSASLSANYNFAENFYVLPRFEWFLDNGVTFATGYPGGQAIGSATLSVEYRPVHDFRLQLEYRRDMSDKTPFANPDGVTSTQSIVTLGGMVSF